MTKKLSTPFALNSTLRNDVPVVATSDQASKGIIGYTNGWTAINKTALANGGQPPYMEDINGVLYDITSNIVDQNKGLPQYFDSDYATLIGGYPIGARLVSSDNTTTYISTIDNNTNNPNSSTIGWAKLESLEVRDRVVSVDIVADLSSIEAYDGRTVYIKGFYTPYKGAHFRVYVQSRASENNGNSCINGWVLIETNPTLAQFGGHCDALTDDSDALQALIDYRAAQSLADQYNGMQTPLQVKIDGSIIISKTINIRGDLVRIDGCNASQITVNKDSTYTDNFVFKITGTSGYASYSGYTGALFKDILFKCDGKVGEIDLFFSGETTATGGNGGVELKNIVNCSFFGFRNVFSNGISGWGWNWIACQACLCNTWMYCTSASDFGERVSFTDCIWQNGGYAFTFAGGVIPVYWLGGSIDYCSGIINQNVASGGNLYLEFKSHFEWVADNFNPAIVLLDDGINVKLSGNLVIGAKNRYTLFKQVRDNQIKIDGLFISGGEGWGDAGVITIDDNYLVDARGALLPNDSVGQVRSAGKMAYIEVIDNTKSSMFAEVTLTNTDAHRFNQTEDGLVFTSGGGSGADGFAYIDVPLTSQIHILYAQSKGIVNTASTIYFGASILDGQKNVKYNLSDYAQISASPSTESQNITHGIINNLPYGARYLRIAINLFGVSSTQPLTINSIKMFIQ